jgi:hypothetical protein
MTVYPTETWRREEFDAESERLVRFLIHADKHGFNVFLQAMSTGDRFEDAMRKGFGTRFTSLDALEREFKPYATQDMALP